MKYPILALVISLTLPANSAGAKDLFVAPNGADTNAGTLARPFKTIRQAAQVAQAGDVVQVRAGTYRETVVPKNDGVAGRPIVFQPYQNEKVTISGTEVLQGWKAGPNGVWQAPMASDYFRSSINQSNQIFVNGQMMNLARWPNTGLDVSRPAKAQLTKFISKTQNKETRWWTAVFEDDNLEPKADGFYNGAEIYVQPNYGAWSWTLSGRVVNHKGKQLTLQSRSGTGQDGKQDVYAVNSRYYLFNKRELLDAPGEWFHDKAQGALFLQPPAGVNLANAIVEAKKRDFGIDLTGRSYITVKGINLFGCTLTTDNAAGGDAVGYNEDGTERYPWRNGEWIAPAHHIVVDGISAKYLNHFTDVAGHFFLQWGPTTGIVIAGQDNLIQNCRVQYSAGNGISLQGLRHKCLNNVVLDTAYMATDTAGISTGTASQTKDLEIAYNTVYRTGRSGITLRQLQNSDPTRLVTRVHHNDIANYAIQDWDAGAFYMFGQDGKWTRIDHNWFHCDEPRTDIVFGAYWDFSKNYILDHNVIWGVPTPIQVTHAFDNDNTKINNFLIYNNTGTTNHATWSHAFGSVENNGSVVQNNILKAASFKDPKGTLILRWPGYGSGKVTSQKNLVWGAVANAGWTEGKPQETDLKADEAGFANPQNGNFQLQAGSPAIDAGVPMQPVEREGVAVPAFNDKIVGAAPDLGAYEFGGEAWKAGSTLATAADKQ